MAVIVLPAIKLTSNAETLIGTSGDDLFEGRLANLSALDVVRGGRGLDTLKFTDDSLKIPTYRLEGLSKIDRLDLRTGTERLEVQLDEAAVTQADNGRLVLSFGDNVMSVKAAAANGAAFVLDGSGKVTLGTGDHSVIVDGFAGGVDPDGHVVGNTGNDTIIGGDGKDRLFGGDGADTLSGGGGRGDLLTGGDGGDRFIVAVGSGTDRIDDYAVGDAMEMIDIRAFTGVTRFEDLVITQEGEDAHIQLTRTDKLILSDVKASELNQHDFITSGEKEPTSFHFEAGASQKMIQAAVDNAPAGSTIVLGAGTFRFSETLIIGRDDISFQGAGETRTKIVLEAADSGVGRAILIANAQSDGGETVSLDAATKAGSTKITVEKSGVIKVGDVVYVSQANDRKWLDDNGNDHVLTSVAPLREMLATVVSVDGKTAILDTESPFTFAEGKATVEVRDPVRNVQVGNFSITTDLGKTDRYNFENTKSAFDGDSTLAVRNATNVSLENIKITNSGSIGFSFKAVNDIEGDGLTTIGSHNKGGGGNGYAFFFDEAFNNTFKNLHDEDMRHGVLFSTFSAEHYNDVHVTFTNRDINFHGGPDNGNVVVVDKMVMDYEAGGKWFAAVQGGDPKNHPLATIEDNDVTFRFLRASTGDDAVHAHVDGGDIAGGDGRDTIRGSNKADVLKGENGDDRILGGSGDDRLEGNGAKNPFTGGNGDEDVLTGGKGRDTFVFRRGESSDVITDFRAADGGDFIDLRDTGAAALKYLAYRQVGDDTVISLGDLEFLTLENVTAANLTSDHFIFSTKANPLTVLSKGGDDWGLVGGNGDDTFVAAGRTFTDARPIDLLGGKGLDTLLLTSGTSFNAGFVGKVRGIDVIDISDQPGMIKVILDAAFAGQADDDYITMKVGGAGVKVDTGNIADPRAVRISGDGPVVLDSGGGHVSSAGSALDVFGGSGADHVLGGRGVDLIKGNNGDDKLVGGGGNDRLEGNADKDFLDGETGANTLIGGSGADRFVIHADGAADKFTDFVSGLDKIVVGLSEFAGLAKLASGKNFFSGSGARPKDDVATLFFDETTNILSFDQDGTGKGAAESIAQLSSTDSLVVSDFVYM